MRVQRNEATLKRFQNRIAESRYALPFMLMFATLVWVAGGLTYDQQLWAPYACTLVAAYLMVELNNINALLRIYSRMVSCSFLALTSLAAFQFSSLQGSIAQLCFVVFYICLFHAYQEKRGAGWVFYAFFCLGMASTVFVQVVFLVPFLWLILGRYLMALSARTFWASILGIIAPYWFVVVYYLGTNRMDDFVAHFAELGHFSPLFDYSSVSEHQIITFLFVALLALIGTIHFLRRSFLDKIRTRMLFHIFIHVNVLIVVFIILQPQHFDVLLKLMMVNTSILIAHYIALTRTRTTNISFYFMIAAALFLTIYNLWIPSLIY
ncbi:MAG: hypothetical protein IKH86_05910 [Prevotella sp.]|nr:hypothetical protein [Prevotella sp.]